MRRMLFPTPRFPAVYCVLAMLLVFLSACEAQNSAETDREALTALYHFTDGPSWLRNSNWLTDAPLKEWHGVTTDEDGRVTGLDLAANEMAGEIPSALGNLEKLVALDLTAERTVVTMRGKMEIKIGGDSPSFGSQVEKAGRQLAESAERTVRRNYLSGCVPSILQDQLDMDSSDLGGLPFCDEARHPTG